MRLPATKKMREDFSGVVNARNGDFSRGRRGRGVERRRLPKWNGGKEERKRENEEQGKNLHRELARKSLGGKAEKRKEEKEKSC